MLIDLDCCSPLTIDPSKYPTTLAIRLLVGGEANGFTGVMAGRFHPFLEHEQNQPVPLFLNEDEEESRDKWLPCRSIFLIDRPPFESQQHQRSYRWEYAATGWDEGVFIGRTYSYEIALTCLERDASLLWSVHVRGERGGFTVVLPDYQPGWKTRRP